MQLLNVNVGKIRKQVIDGAEVETAYVKAPTAQPWVVSDHGIAGNEVAVHADHLYAFDHESYAYWADHLAVERSAWTDGFFAENLTLDSLDLTALRVGDVLSLGETRLVVTGPRVPCWKLSWRLGQPKTFIKHFRTSGRSGVYLGVLRPGTIRAGDRLSVIHKVPENPTVADLALVCDPEGDISDEAAEVVRRALACEELSPTVRMLLTLKQANIDRVRGRHKEGWRGWRQFAVDTVTRESSNVYSFTLEPADGGSLPALEAGQHIAVQLLSPGVPPIVRTWSLSEYHEAPSRYRVTVRSLPGGVGVARMLDAAENGAHVLLRAPGGAFRLSMGGFRTVVLIAGGVGISPLMAMVQAHLGRGAAAPPLWVFYGFRNGAETPFREELEALAGEHEDVHLRQYQSAGDPVATTVGSVVRGRMTAESVRTALEGNYVHIPSGRLEAPWFEADFYICGPESFNTDIVAGLVAAGANADQVHVEEFHPAAEQVHAPLVPMDDARVRFCGAGVEAEWIATQERTLLELGEHSGLDMPSYCRSGSCHTCVARIVRGSVSGPVITTGEGESRALLCSSYPASSEVWLDI